MAPPPHTFAPGKVTELVAKHSEFVRVAGSPPARSPSTSPVLSRSASSSSAPLEAPVSPSPKSSALPAVPTPDLTDSRPDSLAASVSTLSDIKEGEPLQVGEPTTLANGATVGNESDLDEGYEKLSDSIVFGTRDAASGQDDANGDATQEDDKAAPSEPAPPATPGASKADSPLAKILAALPALSIKEQELIKANLDRVGNYPSELPLTNPWVLLFSDTSSTSKQGHGTQVEAYTETQTPIFEAATVPALCGSLKAFKTLVRSKRTRAADPDSMGISGFRPGQNLHFFRKGVSPTWEDPWNQKGGRLTISPQNGMIDTCYERLLLLVAGSALEASAADILKASERNGKEGQIMGIVASRRARGDRVEVWLGGKEKTEGAPSEWVDAIKEVLSGEGGLDMPEVRTGKYKKHFSS